MPSYTVPLAGGGSMTVNASDPQAAADNVRSTGNTPGGPAQGPPPSAPVPPGNNTGNTGGGQTGANVAAGQLLLNQAQQAAYQAYLDAKLKLDSDTEAYQKAAQEASTFIAQAGVTGTYQGQPTQAALKQAADIAAQQANTMQAYAAQFGSWGMPSTGAQTLASQKQMFDEANQAAATTGWYTPMTYNAPSTTAFPSTWGTPQTATAGAAGGTGAGGAPPTQDQYMTARTAQLVGTGMGQQQAQQTAQSEWAQGLAQSGNVAGGMPPGMGGAAAPGSSAGGAAGWQAPTSAQWMAARVPQLQQNGMGAAQAAQTAQSEYAQGYAQSGNVAYGMPSGISFTPPAATPPDQSAPGAAASGQPGQQAGTPLGMPPGWTAGQPVQTLASWQAHQDAAQKYMTLMASLRGPADWAQYQKVLGATPGGTQDLVRAAAGEYIPGGGATTGVAPTPVSMTSFYNQLTGQPGGGQAGSQAPQQGSAPGQGSQVWAQQYGDNLNQQTGQLSAPTNWGSADLSNMTQRGAGYQQASAPQMSADNLNQLTGQLGAPANWGSPNMSAMTQQASSGQTQLSKMQNTLVAPNQMAPQTWNALQPSQQQMLLGVWESQGYSKEDAQNLFNQSLPKYAMSGGQGGAGGSGAFRLQ